MGAPRFPTCAWTVTGRLDGRGPRLWRRGRVVHRPFGTNGPVSRLRGRLSTLSTPPTGNTERFSLFLLSLNRDVLVTGGRRAGAPLEPPSGRGSSSPIAMAARARQPLGRGSRISAVGLVCDSLAPQPPLPSRGLTGGGVRWEAAAAPRSRACRGRPHPPTRSPMAMGEGDQCARGRAKPSPRPRVAAARPLPNRYLPRSALAMGEGEPVIRGEPYFPRPPDGRRAAASRRMPPHATSLPRDGRFSQAPLSGGVGREGGPASREARFLRSPIPDPRDSG